MKRKNKFAQALGRLRKGIKEKPSRHRKASAINNLRKAWEANRKAPVATS